MNNLSRSKNAVLNIMCGYGAQLGTLILSFIGRKIFLFFLSAEYLGINGLFSNILTVLSFAELGLDSALVYSLYKPIAEDDYDLVNSYLLFFKKIYIGLAMGIFAIGCAIIPFLNLIVNSSLPQRELVIYYLLILGNTVASYFNAYKVALLSASQKQRVYKFIALCTNVFMQLFHIIILVAWKNYYLYLAATIVSTLLGNALLSIVCNRLFPLKKRNCKAAEIDKPSIFSRMISTFSYKIGAVLVTNTDNILISALVSTMAVGLYSNYYTIISSAQGFIAILTTSIISGIGNFAAKKEASQQSELFNMMLLLYHFIASVGLLGFSLCFNDFITLWIGSDYLLSDDVVLALSLNFYLTNILNPVCMFREANGLFRQTKYLMLVRALINLVLSYILGIRSGMLGIFVATGISLLATSFWYEPLVLFKYVIKEPLIKYWGKQLKYGLLTAISFFVCYLVCANFYGGIMNFIAKVIMLVCVDCFVFLIFNCRTAELKKLKGYFVRKN